VPKDRANRLAPSMGEIRMFRQLRSVRLLIPQDATFRGWVQRLRGYDAS